MERFVLVAVSLFALTHVDTVIVLVAFFLDADYDGPEIGIGHFVGYFIGLIGAVIATLVAAEFLREWTFLLGLVPLGVGVRGLIRGRPDAVAEPELVPGILGRIGVVTTAGIGLSGENMAVFIPFFVDLTPVELGTVLVLYSLGAVVVLAAAYVLARGTVRFGHIPEWVDRLLVPAILVIVGLYVIVSGVLLGPA